MRRMLALVIVACLAGCGGDAPAPDPAEPPPERPQPDGGSTSPAVPDGGTERGHDRGPGADAAPRRIEVPERDATAPTPTVRLLAVEAGRDGRWPHVRLPDDATHVRATVVGSDEDGGMGRARVAFKALFECRSRETGRRYEEPFVRYVPRPQIARVKITPGTTVRTRLVRRAGLALDPSRCDGGELVSVRGQTWADVTNASGLDATSAHIEFSYLR